MQRLEDDPGCDRLAVSPEQDPTHVLVDRERLDRDRARAPARGRVPELHLDPRGAPLCEHPERQERRLLSSVGTLRESTWCSCSPGLRLGDLAGGLVENRLEACDRRRDVSAVMEQLDGVPCRDRILGLKDDNLGGKRRDDRNALSRRAKNRSDAEGGGSPTCQRPFGFPDCLRPRDVPKLICLDARKEHCCVRAGESVRDQLPFDLEGCAGRRTCQPLRGDTGRYTRRLGRLTSDDPALVTGKRRQLLPDLHDPALDAAGHGQPGRRRRLALENVRDRDAQRRLESSRWHV